MITLSLKMAWDNIRKNKKTYLPFIGSSSVCFILLYICYTLCYSQDLSQAVGGAYISMFINLGTVIALIFIFIFLFYTNSFLMKRRKKELGLYEVLGLEKRHISKILFFELLICLIISLAIGIGLGILLYRAAFILFCRLMLVPANGGFSISIPGVLFTSMAAGLIYLAMFLYSIFAISRVNSIELLHAEQQGEKQPKNKWLLAILGFIFLLAGYIIAVRVKSIGEALMLYFLAVLFVIIGTYLLFTAGSIFILNALQKNKRFYYKENHFINIAQMKFRMKQNAVSLANICILSTMVLVIVSAVFSLYLSLNNMTKSFIADDIQITYSGTGMENADQFEQEMNQVIQEMKDKPESITESLSLDMAPDALIADGFKPVNTEIIVKKWNGKNRLEDGQAVLVLGGSNDVYTKGNLQLGNLTLEPQDFSDEVQKTGYSYDILYVKDAETAREIAASTNTESFKDDFSLDYPDNADYETIGKDIISRLSVVQNETNALFYDTVDQVRQQLVVEYGSTLFIGVILSILFLLMTMLTMYYKQITEGYDDKNRFEILQKVGMDDGMVKKVINTQVLMVFFSPLLVAIIHIFFDFNIMRTLLSAFNFNDFWMFALITAVSVVVYGLIYMVIYLLTSRIYYSIVKSEI